MCVFVWQSSRLRMHDSSMSQSLRVEECGCCMECAAAQNAVVYAALSQVASVNWPLQSQGQHTFTSRSSSCRGSAAFAVASLSTAPPACRSLMFLILGCDCSTAWHTRGLRLQCRGVATEFVVCCLWLARWPRREGSVIWGASWEILKTWIYG